MTERLDNVLLGNNPSPTSKTAWSNRSGREYDLLTWDYGDGGWSVECNLGRIGPGTVGWIYRADGGWGHVAGVIVFDGSPYAAKERGGTSHYCDGVMWRLPLEWWIDGARVQLAGWSHRAPFAATGVRRFRNGESLQAHDVEVLEHLLHPVAMDWLRGTRAEVLEGQVAHAGA